MGVKVIEGEGAVFGGTVNVRYPFVTNDDFME